MNQRCRAHGLEVPLKTKVVPSHVVAHQAFAVRLTSWLVGMFARCSGFRALFAEVFLSVRLEFNGQTCSIFGIRSKKFTRFYMVSNNE